MGFGFSGEMIFLFLLALILFGPKKLPEIGRTIGRFMNEFRRASNEFRSQIESEINASEFGVKPSILPPAQTSLGSIASRIFNPPPAEQIQAAETRAAETPSASARVVQDAATAPENTFAAVQSPPTREPTPETKVAPDV